MIVVYDEILDKLAIYYYNEASEFVVEVHSSHFNLWGPPYITFLTEEKVREMFKSRIIYDYLEDNEKGE